MANDKRSRCTGDTGHIVMLGKPVASISPALRVLS